MPTDWLAQCLPLIAAGNRRVAATLGTVSAADWRRPANCEGWLIADIAGHLAFGASYYYDAIERALKGDASPLWSNGVEGAAERQRRLVRDTPSEGLTVFLDTAARLDAAYARIRPEDLDRTAWHILAPRPLWRYLAMRVYELTLHEWDLHASLDRPAPLPADALPLLTELMLGTLLPLTLSREEAINATFALDLRDTQARHVLRIRGGELTISSVLGDALQAPPDPRLAGDTAALRPPSGSAFSSRSGPGGQASMPVPPPPDCVLRLTCEQLVLALSGRAVWPGPVELSGDLELGRRFRSLFKPL